MKLYALTYTKDRQVFFNSEVRGNRPNVLNSSTCDFEDFLKTKGDMSEDNKPDSYALFRI